MGKLWSLQDIADKINVKPYYQDQYGIIYNNDCRDVLLQIPNDSVDLILTDPPYGINKAEWDGQFILPVLPAVEKLGLMCGVWNIMKCGEEIGDLKFKWQLIAHLVNGMTRGGIGFGNYIPCLVYATKEAKVFDSSTDCKDFVVGTEKKENHPDPKPLRPMMWFVERLSKEEDIILDCFGGSGTTMLACKNLNRKYIGIEINKEYCDIAVERLKQSVMEWI